MTANLFGSISLWFCIFAYFTGGEDVASSVTQIWYSLRLNDKDYCLVISMLQELIEASRQGDWITKARNRGFTNFDDWKRMELYVEELPKEHKASASDWFANGILLPEKSRKKLSRENFTLTSSDFQVNHNKGAFSYKIQSCILSFAGYSPSVENV